MFSLELLVFKMFLLWSTFWIFNYTYIFSPPQFCGLPFSCFPFNTVTAQTFSVYQQQMHISLIPWGLKDMFHTLVINVCIVQLDLKLSNCLCRFSYIKQQLPFMSNLSYIILSAYKFISNTRQIHSIQCCPVKLQFASLIYHSLALKRKIAKMKQLCWCVRGLNMLSYQMPCHSLCDCLGESTFKNTL